MFRLRTVKILSPLVAVAVVGSVRPQTKSKPGQFVGLNITQCESGLSKAGANLPKQNVKVFREVALSDGSKYIGVLQDGQRWGEGQSWDKKGHYKGSWVKHVKCGKGVLKYHNGFTYEGQFDYDLPNGFGKMTLRDGKVFKGEFVNGVLQGQPRSLTYPWGRYEGDVLNYKAHGYGRKIYNNGVVIEGEFCEGFASGQCKKSWQGRVWEGEFANDELISGSYRWGNWPVRAGTFINGKLNGQGYSFGGFGASHAGMFVDNQPHGYGRRTLLSGLILEGTFVNGKAHGLISRYHNYFFWFETDVVFMHGDPQQRYTHTTPAGIVTTDKILDLNWMPPGRVHMVLPDKSELECEFLFGMMHGPTKITYPDGTVEEGDFKCNKQCGRWKTTKPDGSARTQYYNRYYMSEPILLGRAVCLVYWSKLQDILDCIESY